MSESPSAALVRCFEQTFPHLSREEILEASVDNVEGWDSVTHVTLLSLVGQELDLEIDYEELEDGTSFEAILAWIHEQNADD